MNADWMKARTNAERRPLRVRQQMLALPDFNCFDGAWGQYWKTPTYSPRTPEIFHHRKETNPGECQVCGDYILENNSEQNENFIGC